MSPRIKEGDYLYMGFWLLVMGAGMGVTIYLLARIERNTR
jgi:hypothetical protein